jgi:hypothetical protein
MNEQHKSGNFSKKKGTILSASQTFLSNVASKIYDYTKQWNGSTIVCLGYTSVFAVMAGAFLFRLLSAARRERILKRAFYRNFYNVRHSQ